MTIFTPAHCRRLLAATQRPCVSIFMPVTKAGRDARGNRIGLKNLLKAAEDRLVDEGTAAVDAREMMAAAHSLPDDNAFWANLSDGLALFVAPGLLTSFHVPIAFEEKVEVGERFHLRPLLPLLEAGGRFYILAVTLKEVRLFEVTRYSIAQIEPQFLPQDLLKASNTNRYAEVVEEVLRGPQGQTSGGGAATFHGQGAAASSNIKDGERLQYLQRLARGLDEFTRAETLPLVFAGDERMIAAFKASTHYGHVVEQTIPHSPEHLDERQLHDLAWPIVEPILRRGRDETLRRFGERAGTGMAASELESVLMAAHQGAVESLLLAGDEVVWGTVNAEAGEIVQHDACQPGDEDLLDHIATHVLKNSGAVFTLTSAEMPSESPVAALFRYPVAATLQRNRK